MRRRVWEGKREEQFGLEILSTPLIHWANRIVVVFALQYLLWASVSGFENLSLSSAWGLWWFSSSLHTQMKKTYENKMSFFVVVPELCSIDLTCNEVSSHVDC